MASHSKKHLRKEISNTYGAKEIDQLNSQAWELAYDEGGRSLELAECALRYSGYQDQTGQVYMRGAGLALRTMGFIAKMRGDYKTALTHLIEARTLLENLSEYDALVQVLDDLGWVYFNLGDFPQAIEILLLGLKIAREHDNIDAEAAVLNHLGAVYGERGDKEHSIELLQRGSALAPAEPWKSMQNVGSW